MPPPHSIYSDWRRLETSESIGLTDLVATLSPHTHTHLQHQHIDVNRGLGELVDIYDSLQGGLQQGGHSLAVYPL